MLRRLVALGLAAATLAIAFTAAPAADADKPAAWPQFRGPNGTGSVTDDRVPVQWTDKDVLWKFTLPGPGNSSPVVWGDRLFTQASSSDGNQRLLICLDAKSGKEVWTRTVAADTAKAHARNSLASSTPTTDGERVYAFFWDGKRISMAAYDFKGEQVWKRDLGGYTSQHGPGHSPVVHDGKVYLNNDQDGSAVLLCLDARTGKDVWKADRTAHRACYSTPFINLGDGGKPELIVTSTAGITSYEPNKGGVNWTYKWNFPKAPMPLRTVASSIAGDGRVYAASGDGKGYRDTVAVNLGGKGDISDTHLAWQATSEDLPYVPSFLSKGNLLFYVNDKGTAACLDGKTGEVKWTKPRLCSKGVTASPLLLNDKVYTIDESGNVYVFEAAAAFKQVGKSAVGEAVFATPAVANGRLYIRGTDHLFCVGKADKK